MIMKLLTKTVSVICLFLVVPLLVPTPAEGRSDRVDNNERLQFLNEATGNSSGGSSTFENRLNTILSTQSTPERTYVAAQDAEARQNASLTALEENELEEKRLKELNPERYDPKKIMDTTKIADTSAADTARYDGTEKAYEKIRSDIQKEFDQKNKKPSAIPSENAAPLSNQPFSSLPPSLANNPFYRGGENATGFDAKKTVIVNRLMERGLSQEQAAAAVGPATNEEDLVVNLMRDHDISYGDATEISS